MKGEIMASGTTTDQAEKTAQELQEDKTSGTYDAGCHCGYSKFSVTLTPALPETKVLSCNCSACTRFGYLLVCELPPFSLPVEFPFCSLLSGVLSGYFRVKVP